MTSHDSSTESDPLVLRRRAALAGLVGAYLTAGCSGSSADSTPSPSVSAPSFSHVGDPFPITVEGAGDAAVEVTARDRLDQPYRARFEVSGDESPVARPRMLFHALEFADDSGTDPPLAYVPPNEPVEVDVALRRDGERLDSTTVTREYIDPAVESETVRATLHEEERYVGEFYRPAGGARGPGVLALHGSGASPLRRMSKVLASRGYPTLALKYGGFRGHQWGWVPIEYLCGAVSWLRERPEVTDGKIGVVGFSQGARGALVTGINSPAVGAVVSYDGFTTATGYYTSGADLPPWFTLDDNPYLNHEGVREFWEAMLREIEARGGVGDCDYECYKEACAALDPETQAKNTLQIEEIDGPVLLFSGGRSPNTGNWVGPDAIATPFKEDEWMWRRLNVTGEIRLRQQDHDYRYDHVVYGNAEHAFGKPPYSLVNVPSYFELPVDALVRARASAWPHTLDFLAAGIGRPSDEGTAATTPARMD